MDCVATWNTHNEDEKYFNPGKITNNALKRYNCLMNEKFPTPNPSLLVFVQTIELESYKKVDRCENIRRGRIKMPRLQEMNISLVPF